MKLKKIQWLIFVLFFISCSTKTVTWPESTSTSKPWARWWWMGDAVDNPNIERELKEMSDAGIGGVEITSIYGVKGEEDRIIQYLSPKFTDMLNFTIDEAHKLGMGVDLPPGSGWRCGGPFVPEEKGLWSLQLDKKDLKKGESWQMKDGLKNLAAAAFLNQDKESEIIDISKKFIAPENGTVYMALRVKNQDKVKRAAEGGEGWAIDTFNEDITNWYLGEFWKRLGIDEGKLRCFFHDSFEYTGDFTTHFIEEFKQRRGYDLAKYLYVLAGDCDDKEMIARVKSDYRETLSDLVLESFIKPMTEWAHQHKSLNRNQAHGSPGNILDLYAACDIPETEIFGKIKPGSADVFINKFASSAAHVTGNKLVSSESFTWLDEHWTVTMSEMVRATNRFFLAGINHMFFHGICYSPEDVAWPGWLFYASTELNDRNPLWNDFPAIFKYIERTQSILQNATPENDLLVYWPYYDVAAGEGMIFNHLGLNQEADWFKKHAISGLSEKLTAAGHSFDYISDRQLLNSKVSEGEIVTEGLAKYKAVVIPKTKYIPLETMHQLQHFIAEGGKVFFDEELPETVPGMVNLNQREMELAEINSKSEVQKCVGEVTKMLEEKGILGETSLAESGLRFVKINWEGQPVYLIVNAGLNQKDCQVKLGSKAKNYVFLDPLHGEISKAQKHGNSIRIQLNSEQMVLILCSDNRIKAPDHYYESNQMKSTLVNSFWKVEFISGGPVLPKNVEMKKLKSWTKSDDVETHRFAGTARYSTEFEWDSDQSVALMNLGVVKDCAHLWVNGKDYGILLGPVFETWVDNLVSGENTLQIDVSNVAANRIRDLDIRGVNWKHFYNINFVNYDYEPFDASGWEIKDAGLLGPVTLKSE